MKPLIVMSGQLGAPFTTAVSQDWGFTRNSRRARRTEDGFVLEGMLPSWKGVIYYAADPNVEITTQNLKAFAEVPCWPDPTKLLKMVDRHVVAEECFRKGFFRDDPCEVLTWMMQTDIAPVATVDTVVKFGNEHSGEGKVLTRKGQPFAKWDGFATLQPFFTGRSVRVLHLDTAVFFIETINPGSWIKNSPGGENRLFDQRWVSSSMLDHSYKVRDHFGLDVCGNDYILDKDGSFHFLETNQFPGLEVDLLGDLPRNLFLERMRSLEQVVSDRKDALRPEVLPAR